MLYNQYVSVTKSYKHFNCQDVSTILWLGMIGTCWDFQDSEPNKLNGHDDGLDKMSTANHPLSLENETIFVDNLWIHFRRKFVI